MIKKLCMKITVILLASIVMLMMVGCPTDPEPTGMYIPKGGEPGGGLGSGKTGPGWGVSDPSYTGRRFDSDNLPSTAVWNALGHQHAYPSPFHFANGNKVVTKEDWENRRKEISKIVQHYEYGYLPSIDKDIVDITWVDSGVADCTITVTHKASSRTFTFTINTTLPANLATNENRDSRNLPLYFNSSSVNLTGGTGSFPFSGTFAAEGAGDGAVPTLYGINHTEPDAPSANMSYAWGMSVILTVIEGIDGISGFRGYYNPDKIGLTGYSRNGKAAMVIAAFAEGRKGSKVGHVAVGSAGAGGPAVERYLAATGYRPETQYADPLPMNEPGLMSFDSLVGKPWYMKKINNGDLMRGTNVRYEPTLGGTADAWRYTTVRGWSPYFEEFDSTPTNYSASVTIPFIGWQSPAEAWSGIQSLSQSRAETRGWFSPRFQEFVDLHYGLDIDHVRGNEGRSKYGILCTIPFDQYYLGALIAPRGIIYQEGYVVPRNNPEGQFANWIISDEVYKMYGEFEGNAEKYIWNNAFVMIWGTHGGNTGNEAAERNYHAMRVFNGDANTTFALANPNLLKMRTPYFSIDDPVSRFDFYKMNWGRPGHPTVAERVKKYVDPILTDYFAGEANRPFPAAYAPNVHPGYTPTGPKFKAMDWRGILDNPEPLQ